MCGEGCVAKRTHRQNKRKKQSHAKRRQAIAHVRVSRAALARPMDSTNASASAPEEARQQQGGYHERRDGSYRDRRDDSYRQRDHHRDRRRDDESYYGERQRSHYDDYSRDRRREYDSYRDRRGYGGGGDARRNAEDRVSRNGLLCDDDRGGFGSRRSRGTGERERRERRFKSGWDDMGGATETDIAAAQATHAALTQVYASANPSLGLAMGAGPMQATGRKQRELYVGNLLVGVVTADKLKDFFTSILTQCPGYSPQMGPPVAVVQLSGEGKFAFVEFRDETIAMTALQLDKLPLEGRPLNIGRPAGYQPAPGQPLPTPLPLPPSVSGSTAAGAPVDPAAAAAVAALVGGPLPGAPSSGVLPPPHAGGGGACACRCRRSRRRSRRCASSASSTSATSPLASSPRATCASSSARRS